MPVRVTDFSKISICKLGAFHLEQPNDPVFALVGSGCDAFGERAQIEHVHGRKGRGLFGGQIEPRHLFTRSGCGLLLPPSSQLT